MGFRFLRIHLCPSLRIWLTKVPPESRLKGKGLGKVDNLMMGKQALNRHQIPKVNLRSRWNRGRKKVDSSRADEKKECHKGSGDDESEHEYDDRVSLHANDDSELAGNLNNILRTNKGLDRRWKFWLWSERLNTRTWQGWKNSGKNQ